jgi:hypothetical protein
MWVGRDTHLEGKARGRRGLHSRTVLSARPFRRRRSAARRRVRAGRQIAPESPGAAAFFADLRERVCISRKEIIGSLLCCVSQKADCVKSDDEFVGGVAGAAPSLAVKIDERPKSLGFSADDRNHQGKSERPGANERFGSAAAADPNGRWILERTRIDGLSCERSAVLACPVNVSVLTNLE